jgi:hypothetical protein
MKDQPTKPRTSWRKNHVDIKIQHTGNSHKWEDQPGIEPWGVEVLLNTGKGSAAVVIATAYVYRVDLRLCPDPVFELDNICGDLGMIADAIERSADRLNEYSIVTGYNSSILIAQDVVVDRFWRGNQLGPAILFFAADVLRADGIFLTPVALSTRLSPAGVCFSDYSAPRPGPPAQKKVRSAWKIAGFRKLVDEVVWIPISNDILAERPKTVAGKTTATIERLSNEPSGKAWLQRRMRRQTGNVPVKGLAAKTAPGRSNTERKKCVLR